MPGLIDAHGHPVYLTRVDGNSAFANKKAMELAGIDRNTPDPDGGKFIKGADGEPTGVFINQAMGYIKRILSPNTPQPTHAASDMGFVADRVGEERTGGKIRYQ